MVAGMRDPQIAQAEIPVRSKRQAMDWSLVLASQSIEVEIAHHPDHNLFTLVVDEKDQARARGVIELYRKENQGRTWLHEFSSEPFGFDPQGVWWCLLMVVCFVLQTDSRAIEAAGIMDSARVTQGEWWRLVTATFLHQDLGHLGSNLTFGFMFLGLAIPRYGGGVCAIVAILAGACGNYLGLSLRSVDYKGLGASGSVMGLLGLLAMQTWPGWVRQREWLRAGLSSLGGGAALLMLIGLDPRSDMLAHLGGFVAGCVAGSVFAWVPSKELRKKTWSRLFLALTLLAATASWTQALLSIP